MTTADFGTPGEPPTVSVAWLDGIPTFVVGGEVDLATAPALHEAMAGVLDQGGLTLRVDLGQVTFMDSSGLNVLVMALKRVRPLGGRLILANPSTPMLRLLELTGLNAVFEIAA